MHLKLLSLFLVGVYFANEVLSLKFKYKNTECSYYEERKPGGGPRSLVISCPKLKLKKGAKFSCSYKGNPHGCPWYNKKGNQPKFYANLVSKLVNDGKVCVAESVQYKKKCEGFKFHLVKDQVYEEVDSFEPEEEWYIEEEDLVFRPYV